MEFRLKHIGVDGYLAVGIDEGDIYIETQESKGSFAALEFVNIADARNFADALHFLADKAEAQKGPF